MNFLKKIRRSLYGIGIVAGLAFFGYQFVNAAKGGLENSATLTFSFGFLLSFLVFCVVRGAQILAWRELLSGLQFRVYLKSVLENYSVSLLPRYIPGSVWGYLSRAEWLYKQYQIPYSISNYSSVLETTLVLLSFIQVSILYFALNMSLAIGRILLLAVFLASLFLSWWVYSWFHFSPIIRVTLRKLKINSIIYPVPLKSWLISLSIYLAAWFGFGLASQLIAEALHLVHNTNLLGFAFLYGLSWTVGFLFFLVPSGIGVREVAFSQLAIEMMQVGLVEASLFSVLTRIMIFLSEIAWVLVTLLLKIRYRTPKAGLTRN